MESTDQHLLYAIKSDFYSAKVRASLDYQAIIYDELVPTETDIEQVLLEQTGQMDCPVFVSSDQSLLETNIHFVQSLEASAFVTRPVLPDKPLLRFVVQLIELYCDSFLILPALYMRWGYDESAINANVRLKRIFPSPLQAQLHANKERQKLTLYGLTSHNGPFFEYHAEQMVHILDKHFEGYRFVLGERLSLADLALMGPLYAHFYQDVRPRELLLNKAPYVMQWLERMMQADSQESQVHPLPEWSSLSHLPETLYPLIQLIGDDVFQFWKENLDAWEYWAANDRAKGEPLPKFVSAHRFIWNAVAVEQPTSVAHVWQLQNLLEGYQKCDPGDQELIANLLESLDLSGLLEMQVQRRITYKDKHLYHAGA
jgi:glutathione S-transferase